MERDKFVALKLLPPSFTGQCLCVHNGEIDNVDITLNTNIWNYHCSSNLVDI